VISSAVSGIYFCSPVAKSTTSFIGFSDIFSSLSIIL